MTFPLRQMLTLTLRRQERFFNRGCHRYVMIVRPVIEKKWAAMLLTSSVASCNFSWRCIIYVFLAFLRCLHYRTRYICNFSTIYRASFSTSLKKTTPPKSLWLSILHGRRTASLAAAEATYTLTAALSPKS
jgi:hypothetical protein